MRMDLSLEASKCICGLTANPSTEAGLGGQLIYMTDVSTALGSNEHPP